MSFSASVADEGVRDVQSTHDTLSVSLRDGREIAVPLVWYPWLLNATSAQRHNWKIAGGGYAIHWPDLDEDLSTKALLRGAPAPKICCLIHSKTRMVCPRCIARKGGKTTARRHTHEQLSAWGRSGGRPKKKSDG
jgi:hypothetical protein